MCRICRLAGMTTSGLIRPGNVVQHLLGRPRLRSHEVPPRSSAMSIWQFQMSAGVLVALLSVNLHLVLAQGTVEYVGTHAAFQAAAQAGVRHIILNNHMDLRSLPADPLSSLNSTLIINSSTKSMRVRPQACTQRSWTAHQHAITVRPLPHNI